MLRLGKLTDYAVVVLVALAARPEDCLSAASLAAETALPEPTVAKILKLCAASGLVVSQRGACGGYRLSRPAASVAVTDIISAMEGPVSLTACAGEEHEGCALEGKCNVEGRWQPVNRALTAALANVMLTDMMPPLTAPERQTA